MYMYVKISRCHFESRWEKYGCAAVTANDFFLLRLILLGVATADPISPLPPVFHVLPCHPNRLHILPHNIHISTPRPPPPPSFSYQAGPSLARFPMYLISVLCTCPNILNLSSLTFPAFRLGPVYRGKSRQYHSVDARWDFSRWSHQTCWVRGQNVEGRATLGS